MKKLCNVQLPRVNKLAPFAFGIKEVLKKSIRITKLVSAQFQTSVKLVPAQ